MNGLKKHIPLVLWLLGTCVPSPAAPQAGWGVDAAVGCEILEGDDLVAAQPLLERATLGWLRARGVEAGNRTLPSGNPWFASYGICAFAVGPAAVEEGDQLCRDLLAVFDKAKRDASAMRGRVAAWEMVGEPDVGYCKDLPDRVAAYQKAQYLGLKAGNPDAIVLMGALALPPGPWLERATANGLFSATDALNVHFYGSPDDFTPLLQAHEDFASRRGGRPLPVWVTECGHEFVYGDEVPDSRRESLHAGFMESTALQVLARESVAVFMPFIFHHPGDPNAMVASPRESRPSWDTYAAVTRTHPFPGQRRLVAPPSRSPIIIEWSPFPATVDTRKSAGTYQFVDNHRIRGKVKVYNLGDKPLTVDLKLSSAVVAGKGLGLGEKHWPLTLAPHSMTSKRLTIQPRDAGEQMRVALEARVSGEVVDQASFDVGQRPEKRATVVRPLALTPFAQGLAPQASLTWEPLAITGRAGVWMLIEGQEAEDLGSGVVRLKPLSREMDAMKPPYLAARLSDVPKHGFLHVVAERPLGEEGDLRVDLLDRHGQRFSHWEHFGKPHGLPTRELWLALEDFQALFFGRITTHSFLNPKDVVEIQLRPYLPPGSEALNVRLEWRVPPAEAGIL